MDLPFYMTENQAMATKKKLYLYNEDIKYFGEIGLTIGISNDSKIETKYIYCKLEKCLDTYIPPDSYYRSDPLPDS